MTPSRSANPASSSPTTTAFRTVAPTFVFPPGTFSCPPNQVVIGTDPTNWKSLTGCAAMVGLNPTPTFDVQVGQTAFVVAQSDVGKPDVGKPDVGKPDVGKPHLTAAPSGVVAVHGLTITGVKRGRATINVSGLSCLPDEAAEVQPHICPLVTITVS